MKILVINTGSSSIKYELFDVEGRRALAGGIAEKIGEERSLLSHRITLPDGSVEEKRQEGLIADHREGLNLIADLLVDRELGIIGDKAEIAAVGHRVVHGGERFQTTTIIDKEVMAAIEENIPLAPLHNPPNLVGIEVAESVFPDSVQVAVFDTAFHQTIPRASYLYAIPYRLYEKHKVRRYGFHGTSHAYVAERAADYIGKPLGELNLITIHLGNGASMAALKNGKSVDTTMGMTPLSGLVMGTRCGDVDPALPFFLADHLEMSLAEIDNLLNKESGLKGLCGTNDMRKVIEKMAAEDEQAKIALEIYVYRIKKYIGAYFAVLEDLDALVFTAGIGENASLVREMCCRGLHNLGIEIDPSKNDERESGVRDIGNAMSKVKILVIPTNEALRIAQETRRVIERQKS